MRLSPGTHLLLYGRSSFSGIVSVLRAGSAHFGELERTELISSARDCRDPRGDPFRKDRHDGFCDKDCDKWMNCGLDITPCGEDPHSITVDYMKNGATITTVANHAQSQRLGARLDDWLRLVSPKGQQGDPRNFTHGAFMDPHAERWFDGRCETGTSNEPGEPMLRAQAGSKGQQRLMQAGHARPLKYWDGAIPEQCRSDSDGDCPRRHPHWSRVRKWIDQPLAAVMVPPRDDDFNVPFQQEEVNPKPLMELEYEVPEEHRMRCVTDEQLVGCPFRNTTVWLAQSKQAYEYGGATLNAPSACDCAHTCNSRCVSTASGQPNCYLGPGVMSAWLVLRAVGLAKN
jgi:hypothetical protein